MILSKLHLRLPATLMLGLLCTSIIGCTQKQLEMAAQFSAALNDFIQNKAIAEQAAREVKAVCSTSDSLPSCENARSLYEDARDMNDELISQLAVGAKSSVVRSLHGVQPRTVRDAAVRFLSQSSIILSPGLDTRSIALEQAIVIADSLPESARKINGATRAMMFNTYAKQVRWAAWDAISATDAATQSGRN